MPPTRRRRRADRGADFADLLHMTRRREGYTQEELATAAGTNRGTIVSWEANQSVPLPDAAPLRAVCTKLGIRYTDALIALGTLTADDLTSVAA